MPIDFEAVKGMPWAHGQRNWPGQEQVRSTKGTNEAFPKGSNIRSKNNLPKNRHGR